jgi:hypothetical protein
MSTRSKSIRWVTPGLLLLLVLWIDAQPTNQSLYYLCATFPVASNGITRARLYSTPANGGPPQLVRVVGKSSVDAVLADYDRRKLVVASPGTTPHTFSVVDMAAPEKEHSATIDYDALDVLPYAIHVLDIPQKGLWVAMPLGSLFKTPPIAATALTAVSLEAEGAKVESLPFAALADTRPSGSVGGALVPTHMNVWVRGDPLRILLSGAPAGCNLNIPQPPYLKTSADDSATYNLVAVNDILVLLTPDTPKPAARDVIDIYYKDAHAWRRATLPFTASAVRAFGPWVTAISARPRGGPEYGKGRVLFNAEEFRRMPPSPGQEKRLSDKVDERFDDSSDYFSGDLLVLNARTDERYVIQTGQGDSEVILVTDKSVYYRVNDAIFRADIASGKLSTGIKIAEGPDVPQAHWAFIGSAAPGAAPQVRGR